MEQSQVEKFGEIVDQVARYYAPKCPWTTREDIAQQGWVIACEISLRKDLDASLVGGYLRRALSRSLSRYCWQQTGLISTKDEQIRATPWVPVDPLEDLPTATAGNAEYSYILSEALAFMEKARAALLQRVHKIISPRLDREDPQIHAMLDILIHGRKPASAAAAYNISSGVLNSMGRNCVNRIRNDEESMRLLSEIREHRKALCEYQLS